MTVIQPKIALDAVAQTSSIDLYVGSVYIATYKYANGMFTLMMLPNDVLLDKAAVNTNYLAKDGWIRAMVNAGFGQKLYDIIPHPPTARPQNRSAGLLYTDLMFETATTFEGYLTIGDSNNKSNGQGGGNGHGDMFTAVYDKTTKLTRIASHPVWTWTPEQFGVWWAFIVRFVDRVNMDQ